jgi:uncharacterized membrane protein HdeD (DUF308 family)
MTAWWGALFLLCGAGLLLLLVTNPGSMLALAWMVAVAALFAGLTMVSRALLLRAAARRGKVGGAGPGA